MGFADIHFIDFEGSATSGVVEYGCVTVRDNRVVASHTRLCAPTGPMDARESAVHGLHAIELSGHAPFLDDWEWWVELRRSGVFGAHNQGAEHTFLKRIWPFPPFVPDWLQDGERIAEWGPWLDTLRIFRKLYPQLPQHGLSALIGTFGLQIKLEQAALRWCPAERRSWHSAPYDALASALLYLYLKQLDSLQQLSDLDWLKFSNNRDGLNQSELF